MLQLTILTLTGITAGLTAGYADVTQYTVQLPPAGGAYTFPGACIMSPVANCLEGGMVSDFAITNVTTTGSYPDYVTTVDVNAVYSAEVYTNNGGSPGTPIAPLSLTGTMAFTYSGYSSETPIGTFATQVTFDFSGIFNGNPSNTFVIEQNPMTPSTGTTTLGVVPSTSPTEYDVSSSLTINAEYDIRGLGPITAHPVTSGLISTPEPGYAAVGAALLFGMLGLASRRRRVQ
jgi:hypothetical protein